MNKKPCIILTGPTAVGKTTCSIRLAKAVNGSVISADSMQVYRGMDIGSAKITPDEMDGIPHDLIDILEPEESFDVYQFQKRGSDAMDKIYAENRIPLIVGGTGFYIQALLKEVNFSETSGHSAYRETLEARSAEPGGAEALFEMLQKADPESAAVIHPNNLKRVIRALEYYHETGRPISLHNEEQHRKDSPFNYAYFVLTDDRKKIYDRIELRVDQMIEAGLEKEVRALYERGLTESHTSMKGLGYREWFPYFRGECTRGEVIRRIKLDTRHFAKRQLTWFRREPDVIWIDLGSFGYDIDAIVSHMVSVCAARGILLP
ncbi:MAG: tRNA (adenosine(37)-N6)-dimethylallyltransferase MiaA [Eubacterium sp.]|nr:tRNA (adenosine(37)-N6)-dimethylallyltransferase MiaA [Eubacterium sp.]